MPEQIVRAPGWEWWIIGYFFLAGIAGGSYVIGAMLRLWGAARDEAAARIAFLVSFPALVVCPVLLSLDLGQPLRFWHMLVDVGQGGLAFKYWSPISVGSWALLVFGLFSFGSFVEALGLRGGGKGPAGAVAGALSGGLGRAWNVVGMLVGLFVAGYTGILLAVSNQPIWSDGWALGGLFLASGLTGSGALLLLLVRSRAPAAASEGAIAAADRWFAILEVALIAVFLVSVAAGGLLSRLLGPWWLLLWVVVAAGLVASVTHDRWRGTAPRAAALLALVGVLALRALIVLSAQL